MTIIEQLAQMNLKKKLEAFLLLKK